MPEVHVRDTITINRGVGEIYKFWRHLENLPRFIGHLDSVEDLGGGRNRWTIKTPLGQISFYRFASLSVCSMNSAAFRRLGAI